MSAYIEEWTVWDTEHPCGTATIEATSPAVAASKFAHAHWMSDGGQATVYETLDVSVMVDDVPTRFLVKGTWSWSLDVSSVKIS